MQGFSFWLIATSVLFVAACGGGGGGSDSNNGVVGLTLPASINVAAPNAGNNTQTTGTLNNRVVSSIYSDAGTDYNNDSVNYYSGNDELFNLEIANAYLCVIEKLHATQLVNQGPYIAQLNEKICATQSSEDSNTSIEIIVDSSRASNNAPHNIKMWIPLNEPEFISAEPNAIDPFWLIEVVIHESAGDQNPYGIFDINYGIIVDSSFAGDEAGSELLYGAISFKVSRRDQTPYIEYMYISGSKFNPSIDDYGFEMASVTKLTDLNGNSGLSKSQFTYDDVSVFNNTTGAAFDNNSIMVELHQNDIVSPQCLSRSDFVQEVIDYNLYFENDADFRSTAVTGGQRVELTNWITFSYNGGLGSLSESGYWLPNSGELPDQATVADFHTNETYTVHISPGKLERIDRTQEPADYSKVNVTDTILFPANASEATLYCYQNCPMGGVTQEMVDAALNIYDLYHNNDQAPFTYTIAVESHKLILKDNSSDNAAVDFSQLDLTTLSTIGNRIRTGYMYPQAIDYPADALSGIYYQWLSGQDQYYRLVTFTDSNNQLIVLDPSLDFDYTHDAADDRFDTDPNTNLTHNADFRLYYGGAGDLWGFPEYIDAQGNTRHASLRDGVILQNSEGSFAVKATGVLNSSVEIDASECTALDASAALNNLQLPSAEDIVHVSFMASDQPDVEDPPRVIDGKIQE